MESISDCPYGDKTSGCEEQHCYYNNQYTNSCCQTCGNQSPSTTMPYKPSAPVTTLPKPTTHVIAVYSNTKDQTEPVIPYTLKPNLMNNARTTVSLPVIYPQTRPITTVVTEANNNNNNNVLNNNIIPTTLPAATTNANRNKDQYKSNGKSSSNTLFVDQTFFITYLLVSNVYWIH